MSLSPFSLRQTLATIISNQTGILPPPPQPIVHPKSNPPQYLLERENVLANKSDCMAFAENELNLLYAFGVYESECNRPHSSISLLYFQKLSGSYHKKECLKLQGQKITKMKFGKGHSPAICLYAGTNSGSLIRVSFMGSKVEITHVKLSVYAIEEIHPVPGKDDLLLVLVSDETLFLVHIGDKCLRICNKYVSICIPNRTQDEEKPDKNCKKGNKNDHSTKKLTLQSSKHYLHNDCRLSFWYEPSKCILMHGNKRGIVRFWDLTHDITLPQITTYRRLNKHKQQAKMSEQVEKQEDPSDEMSVTAVRFKPEGFTTNKFREDYLTEDQAAGQKTPFPSSMPIEIREQNDLESAKKQQNYLCRYSLVPFCQVSSLFPHGLLWVKFFGAALAAIQPNGQFTIVAVEWKRLFSQEYQIITSMKLFQPQKGEILKCVLLDGDTLLIGKEGKMGESRIEKFVIRKSDYVPQAKLSIVLSELKGLQEMMINKSREFLLCRSHSNLMVCYEEETFQMGCSELQ